MAEATYEDLMEFLELDRAEGEDLDYKQEWHDRYIRTVCAMANTAGGDLLVGVGERRDRATKTNRPDPASVSGVERKPRDLAQSVAAKVRARTRPSLSPEVEAVEVEGKPDRVVLLVRVAESQEAPHEVRLGPSPEIPVRRRDNTESAGIDDVERLLRRRDALRDPKTREVDIDFFDGRVALPGDELPPVLAVWMRPRLATGLRFDLDHALDERLELLFRRHYLGNGAELAPFSAGLALEGKERGVTVSRVEIREDGTIRGAWGLQPVHDEAGQHTEENPKMPEDLDRPWLVFDEVAYRLTGAARFAASAYGMRRTAVEVDFFFGLHRCLGFRVIVPETRQGRPTGVIYDPTSFSSYCGRVPGHPMGHEPTYGSFFLRTEGDGDASEPVGEDLLELVRRASRAVGVSAVGVSAPDSRLERYLA